MVLHNVLLAFKFYVGYHIFTTDLTRQVKAQSSSVLKIADRRLKPRIFQSHLEMPVILVIRHKYLPRLAYPTIIYVTAGFNVKAFETS